MNITKQDAITLMNSAIQDAIGKEVHKELSKNYLSNTNNILKTIDNIDDPKIKENLTRSKAPALECIQMVQSLLNCICCEYI